MTDSTIYSQPNSPRPMDEQSNTTILLQIDYEYLVDKYNLTDELIKGTDYFKVGEVNGFILYSPNDEDWGDIIAVHHQQKLASYTGFEEADDMLAEHGEYAPVAHYGVVVAKYEIED